VPARTLRLSLLRHLLTICFVLAALTGWARGETARITFVLVNDIYLMGDELMPDGKRRGGFARLAAVVKAERAKGHVVFAHAGDTISPSIMSGLDQGAHVIALTNMIAPDIFVPGNHEFDFGKAVFFKRMAEAKFPLLAANLRGPDGQPLAGFRDRRILTIAGVKIGITGATSEFSVEQSSPEDLKFSPTVETITRQAAELRREGADFIVAVVHANRKIDYALLESRACDLILTGDDHDLFVNFDGRTAMVESSSDAHYVTAIDIHFAITNGAGKRQINWWPRFRVIDTATVTPDAKVARAVQSYERELSKEFDAPLATTAVTLDSRAAAVRTGEAAIGNLVADALRAATGADAAVFNGGGIRANKVYAPGSTITRRDLLKELPFGNRITLIEVSGKALKEALENGLSQIPSAAGRFPQVSGLTIEANASAPAGSRITSITIAGRPLQDSKTYKIATNDFMARGGDGYTSFQQAKQIIPDHDGALVANDVMAYVRKLGTVRTGIEGRVVLKP
jgi:5'-nucleotidase/UDP-sugar diphosphatase